MHLEAWQMQVSGHISLIFLEAFTLLLPGIHSFLPCIFSSSCQAPCILFFPLLLGEFLLLLHWSLMLHQFCSVMRPLSLFRRYFFLPHPFALGLCWTEYSKWIVAWAIHFVHMAVTKSEVVFQVMSVFFKVQSKLLFADWMKNENVTASSPVQVFWASQGIF